jgi:hypothetical protein
LKVRKGSSAQAKDRVKNRRNSNLKSLPILTYLRR